MSLNRASYSHRSAFSLLELMLALSLIVVVAALVSQLMQLYARDFATRGDDIRRQQLARSLLHMIADDIRAVVVEPEYDPSVLETLLGGASEGAAPAGDTGDLGGDIGLGDTGLASGLDDTAEDAAVTDVVTSRTMGIYGDQFSIMVDVSRVPRTDQYEMQAAPMNGTLVDIPGDLKSVTYYVQAATNQGVQDSMSSFTLKDQTEAFSSGLIRRALDRRVADYAEEMGDLDRLQRTGTVVAPEVVSVEFSYFDGVEWVYEWDSEQQGLPWLVQILLAMQSASGAETAELEPGVPISQMSLTDRQMYNIDVYELTVAIPGAQLQATDSGSADAAAGLDAMGL
ncbi:MAG: prepilin-type N-terminal cleavage/methylation domain-containing protein [Aureliella sp.]